MIILLQWPEKVFNDFQDWWLSTNPGQQRADGGIFGVSLHVMTIYEDGNID